MDDKDLQLEEILKEYGKEPVQPKKDMTGDTIRLDKIQKSVNARRVSSDTAVFTPVGGDPDPEYEAPPRIPQKEAAEPYSDAWEPEYDEPMGEYSPPIVFQPKDRLHSLRAQLVEGPERRYYELMQLGLGKLQLSIFLNFLLLICAVGITALTLELEQLPRLAIFGQLLILLLSGLLGCYRLMEGIGHLGRLRFSLQSFLVFAFAICLVDGVLALSFQRPSCCGIFSLHMLMAQLSAHHSRSAEIGRTDTLRKASDLSAVVKSRDFLDGRPGYLTAQGSLDSYLENEGKTSGPEKLLQFYGLIALLASIGLGVLASLENGFNAGIQVMTGAVLVAMPATASISCTKPQAILEKRLHKLGVVLCGWEGVKQVKKEGVYPLHHREVLPEGSLKFNGVKFLGSVDPDTVVSFASSLALADGGSLGPLFEKLLRARNGRCREVTDLHSYEGGVSGLVEGVPAVLGTLEFMQRMDVTIPQGTKVSQAVCLAIQSELVGVFAVHFTRSKGANMGLKTLCGYQGLHPVLVSSDLLLSPAFLEKHFSGNTDMVVQLPRQQRAALEAVKPQADDPVIALMTREGLASKAYAVTGSRVLRSSMRAGAWVHLLGGVIGLLAAAVLTLAGAGYILAPMNVLGYSLAWMIPGWLIPQWTRVV